MKNKIEKSERTVLGVGWYREDQWEFLLKNAVDREDLEKTYSEWLEGITEGMKNFSKSGIQCKKIPVDVNEMINWCINNRYPFDGASRSVFISLKTKKLLG